MATRAYTAGSVSNLHKLPHGESADRSAVRLSHRDEGSRRSRGTGCRAGLLLDRSLAMDSFVLRSIIYVSGRFSC